MEEYAKGTLADKADITDFINYVFSHDHRPHDFKRLQPVIYGDSHQTMPAEHYLVKEDGKIKANIAFRTVTVQACGHQLKVGQIGNVAVHPYARSRGYMKGLMHWILEDAQKDGVDYIILGGQRQRYGYFGFDPAGYQYTVSINSTNIRHAFRDVDASGITFELLTAEKTDDMDFAYALYQRRPFYVVRSRSEFPDLLHNFGCDSHVIRFNGERIGYSVGGLGECELTDEAYYPKVVKAAFEQLNSDRKELHVSVFQPERAAFLAEVCEGYSLTHIESLNVLRWKNVLQALLALKAQSVKLNDGEVFFEIEGEPLCIRVQNGQPTVETPDSLPENARHFTHHSAQMRFLTLGNFVHPEEDFRNWLPLPLFQDTGDFF